MSDDSCAKLGETPGQGIRCDRSRGDHVQTTGGDILFVLAYPGSLATISDEEAEKALLGRHSPRRAHAVVTLLQYYRQGGGSLVTPVVDEVTGRKPRTAAAFISEHLQSFQAA